MVLGWDLILPILFGRFGLDGLVDFVQGQGDGASSSFTRQEFHGDGTNNCEVNG